MASLNTLRTKYGIVLSVVIGLVLVAFILGDQLSYSGAQKAPNGVEKVVNGRNITTQELAEAQQMVGTDVAAVDMYLGYKYFYAPQFAALGLETEDVATMQKTVAQYLANNGATKENVEQYFSQLTPIGLIAVYRNIIANETLAEGVFLNTADLELMQAMNNLTFSGRYVEYSYDEMADVVVEEAEIKAYYDEHPVNNDKFNARYLVYVELEDTTTMDALFAASDVESFKAAADEAGLEVLNKMANEMAREINEWAAMTTVGAVREFMVGEKTIVAMVESIDENEFMPYEERVEEISKKLKNDKKFAAIAETMTLDGEVKTFTDASFNTMNLDTRVKRSILVANVGEEYKVNGQDAAYIFVVDEVKGELGDVAAQRESYTTTHEGFYVGMAYGALDSELKVEDPAQE
jgi:hypothetical protein